MKGVAKLKFTLVLPASFTQEGDWIVGCFPDLDVCSQGHTQHEAERNLIEAAQIFIESCFARNVLDEVLKNCGFVPGQPNDQQRMARMADVPHLTVPFELLAASYAPSAIAC